MKPFLAIKHKRFRDVFFKVTKATPKDDFWFMSCDFYNLGFTESWLLDPYHDFILRKDELYHWDFTEDAVECYRKAQWYPLNETVLNSFEQSTNPPNESEREDEN